MAGVASSITHAFERVPYLGALGARERAALSAAAREMRVPATAAVFREGDPPAGIFVIVSGRIKLVRSSADGREQVLHEEGDGRTLAEVPVFDGAGYVATAIAVTDSVVVFVPRAPLLAALTASPRGMLEVVRTLAGRVRRLAAVVEDLSLRAVTGRVAAYLMAEMERAGRGDFDLPTREHLAAHVGTVREQASRALSSLKAAGAIDIQGRRVRIADLDLLRGLAGIGPGPPGPRRP